MDLQTFSILRILSFFMPSNLVFWLFSKMSLLLLVIIGVFIIIFRNIVSELLFMHLIVFQKNPVI